MGWNAQPTCAIMMDNVRVPAASLLGEEGKGFNIAMNACNVADARFMPFHDALYHACTHALHQLGFGQYDYKLACVLSHHFLTCSEWRTHQHSQLQVNYVSCYVYPVIIAV